MPRIAVGAENDAAIEIHYEDHGTGAPVVLIGGYPLNGNSWERRERELQASFNIAGGASPYATYACVDTWLTDFRADLPKIDVPTLVVHGTEDRTLPFAATAGRLPALIADLAPVRVEGGPHIIGWTHPEEVNRALLDFLGSPTGDSASPGAVGAERCGGSPLRNVAAGRQGKSRGHALSWRETGLVRPAERCRGGARGEVTCASERNHHGVRHQGLERLPRRRGGRRHSPDRPAVRRGVGQQRVVLVLPANRGRVGQALVLFVIPLVTGILLPIPGQSTTTLGIEIAAFGLLVGRTLLALGGGDLAGEPRALVFVDSLSPRGLILLALVAAGVSLIAGRYGGLYWLAGAHVCALMAGLLNAWIFLLVAGSDSPW
jgi:hypothetical protein